MDYKEMVKDVQCITCFDKFILEYFINDCFVQCEKISGKISVNIKYLSLDDKKRKEWYRKNIFNLPLYQEFVNQ